MLFNHTDRRDPKRRSCGNVGAAAVHTWPINLGFNYTVKANEFYSKKHIPINRKTVYTAIQEQELKHEENVQS